MAREHYVTTLADLEKMKNLLQEGVVKEMGEITLALFYQLQAPGTDEDGLDPEEGARKVVRSIKEIFGISPDPESQAKAASDPSQPQENQQDADATEEEKDQRHPNITAAKWQGRERARQLPENILTRQVEICEAQRKTILMASLAGPSPYERAGEIAPTHPNARLMRRMQDSNFREVRRFTNLLLKIKRYERKMEALEQDKHGSADL